jgi:signal transduction histidine kinase
VSAADSAATARASSFFDEAVAEVGARLDRSEAKAPDRDAGSARLVALLDRCTADLAKARAKLPLEVRRRRALESAMAAGERRHDALIERSRVVTDRMRRLSHRLLSSQEAERARIGRDLHDSIGQTLTGINVGLATLRNDAGSAATGLSSTLAMTQLLVERSMETVHQIAADLHPSLLDNLGLVPALRSCTKAFSSRTGIGVRFAADAGLEALDVRIATALFRVAEEALSNVERHARAGHVSVVLRSVPGAVRLEVEDDGRAFDARRAETRKAGGRLGLLVMRERVEMVGGALTVESSPRRGTTVRADVPLKAVPRD